MSILINQRINCNNTTVGQLPLLNPTLHIIWRRIYAPQDSRSPKKEKLKLGNSGEVREKLCMHVKRIWNTNSSFSLKKTFSKWNKVWISQLPFCFGEFYPSYTSRQRTQYYEKVTGNYYPGCQSTKLDSLLTQELHWALMVARGSRCPKLGQRPPAESFPTTNKALYTFCVPAPVNPKVSKLWVIFRVTLYQPRNFYAQALWARSQPRNSNNGEAKPEGAGHLQSF